MNMQYAGWLELLRRAHDALIKFASPHRPAEFQAKPPASAPKLHQVQQAISEPMPEPLSRIFLEFSQGVYLSWFADKTCLSLPEVFREVSYGQCELDLETVEHICRDWFVPENLIRSPEHSGMCEFDYTSLFPLMQLNNGDLLVLVRAGEHEGKVVYFAHDDGSMPILARSLDRFLEPWFELGCPGPDLPSLVPFLDTETEQLSSISENAILWREVIGLA
jgi:hypothetical protein